MAEDGQGNLGRQSLAVGRNLRQLPRPGRAARAARPSRSDAPGEIAAPERTAFETGGRLHPVGQFAAVEGLAGGFRAIDSRVSAKSGLTKTSPAAGARPSGRKVFEERGKSLNESAARAQIAAVS